MWLVYALASAIFASLSAIFAKIGLKEISSNLASLLKTFVILLFTIIFIILFTRDFNIASKSLILLILSGVTTSLAWLSYFKAIQLTEVKNISPIDKSSTILTMLLALIFLKESINFISLILISLGIVIMIERKKGKYVYYAICAAVFSSITAILAKIGIPDMDTNLATLIRSIVVCIICLVVVLFKQEMKDVKKLNKTNTKYIVLSGLSTGLSWITFYQAIRLQDISKVSPIEKLNILFTIIFSYYILKEKVSKKEMAGLALIVIGTIYLIK